MKAEEAGVAEILRAHEGREGRLLPILHAVQADYGYISEPVIQQIANHLNLSRAEVSGVVSFYHDFRRTPDPRPSIKLCRAEACQARGSEPLAGHAARISGGRVAIQTVYCLGLCSVGPNAMIGDAVHARLDAANLTRLIEAL